MRWLLNFSGGTTSPSTSSTCKSTMPSTPLCVGRRPRQTSQYPGPRTGSQRHIPTWHWLRKTRAFLWLSMHVYHTRAWSTQEKQTRRRKKQHCELLFWRESCQEMPSRVHSHRVVSPSQRKRQKSWCLTWAIPLHKDCFWKSRKPKEGGFSLSLGESHSKSHCHRLLHRGRMGLHSMMNELCKLLYLRCSIRGSVRELSCTVLTGLCGGSQ
mmetsp:Transcript_60171/g.147953  ORF Transcript_60171/g.147953 Transcript_60171/m.147953 type:complete len:211 (+) Transcript_60171:395-1027(+)